MKIYGFFYNSCIYESAAALQSLHFSKEGAEAAMNRHKETEHQKWLSIDFDEDYKQNFPFGWKSVWLVKKMEVLP